MITWEWASAVNFYGWASCDYWNAAEDIRVRLNTYRPIPTDWGQS